MMSQAGDDVRLNYWAGLHVSTAGRDTGGSWEAISGGWVERTRTLDVRPSLQPRGVRLLAQAATRGLPATWCRRPSADIAILPPAGRNSGSPMPSSASRNLLVFRATGLSEAQQGGQALRVRQLSRQGDSPRGLSSGSHLRQDRRDPRDRAQDKT